MSDPLAAELVSKLRELGACISCKGTGDTPQWRLESNRSRSKKCEFCDGSGLVENVRGIVVRAEAELERRHIPVLRVSRATLEELGKALEGAGVRWSKGETLYVGRVFVAPMSDHEQFEHALRETDENRDYEAGLVGPPEDTYLKLRFGERGGRAFNMLLRPNAEALEFFDRCRRLVSKAMGV
jgi:hypothetical protein